MNITNYLLFSGPLEIDSDTLTLKALDRLESKEKQVKNHLNNCAKNGSEEARQILDLLKLLEIY